MTRARRPYPHEVAAAREDPRLVRAYRQRRSDSAWRTRGACQSSDPETFFPAPTDTPDAAIALCRGCPVAGPCLAWALDAGDCHGVWGGTTGRERRAMLVAWRLGPRDGTETSGAGMHFPSPRAAGRRNGRAVRMPPVPVQLMTRVSAVASG